MDDECNNANWEDKKENMKIAILLCGHIRNSLQHNNIQNIINQIIDLDIISLFIINL